MGTSVTIYQIQKLSLARYTKLKEVNIRAEVSKQPMYTTGNFQLIAISYYLYIGTTIKSLVKDFTQDIIDDKKSSFDIHKLGETTSVAYLIAIYCLDAVL